jgi:glycerate kinase
MKILIAPDKFKGVLTAREAAENMAAGIGEVLSEAQLELVPMADGGEGTVEVVGDALGGEWRECEAHDGQGRPVAARYVWIPAREAAIVAVSEVAGLKHFHPGEQAIDRANTFGVGEMMIDAAGLGARQIIVALGGSVTNDGGFGMARAIGLRFFNRAGMELQKTVTELRNLARIEGPKAENRSPLLRSAQVIIAADVRNPLLGANGATRVFGPQKGVTEDQVHFLEEALERLADVVARDFGIDYRAADGAGAAGGLGFGLMSFCDAAMRPGFEVVSEAVGLESKMEGVDVIVTGEGSLDRQTLGGKVPAEVARMAQNRGIRVFAIVGRTDGDGRLQSLFDGIIAVADSAGDIAENMRRAPELLRKGGRQLASLLR